MTRDIETDERIAALAKHLECSIDDVSEERGDLYGEGECFSAEGGEYVVCTDEEADRAWDASLDSYIDDCIMPELSGTLSQYFDTEKWKRDARFDGRGHSLSSYDSNENEIRLSDGSYLYIYRTN